MLMLQENIAKNLRNLCYILSTINKSSVSNDFVEINWRLIYVDK